ncbi:MAG: hypothetical protein JWM34_4704 [Ilumatobacteraceae bacterium]|nr:hypothetical protein [Ilumatobacteraceae bacterium]
MMKRVTWFLGGAVAGVAGVGYAKRKVVETASQLAPVNVAKSAVGRVRERGNDVIDAVRDGRDAMRAKENELRAKLHGVPTLAEELDPADVVLVDGHPVEPGQVIVLRQVRDDRTGPRRNSRRSRRGA